MNTTPIVIGLLAVWIGWSACKDASASAYVDLETGEQIEIEKNESTGEVFNTRTGKLVRFYVDVDREDTIYGRTGEVVNNKLYKDASGDWAFEGEMSVDREDDGDYTIKQGDDKIKMDDGEYKVKRGEYKREVEKDGDVTVKIGDDYKKEVEADGDVTIKDGNKKIKIDGETGERKVKYDD